MGRILILGALLALMGCHGAGSARYVSQKGDSGVVAISSNTTNERSKGLALIAQHVGPQYIIEMEEVVPVPPAPRRKDVSPVVVFLTLQHEPASEHRIHYRRSKPAMTATTTTSEPALVQASYAEPPIHAKPTAQTKPASHTEPAREAALPPAPTVKNFLPLPCVGCQSR